MNNKNDIELIWNFIVKTTESSKCPEYKGLRNSIFLSTNRNGSLKRFLFHIKSILFILIKPKKNFNYPISENKILFYFPFNSSANFNNLYPVYELAKKYNLDGLVIKNKKVNLPEGIIKENLYSYVSLKNRYVGLINAIVANHKLYKAFKKNKNRPKVKYFYLENLSLLFQIFIIQSLFEDLLKKIQPISVVSTSDYFPIDFALFNTANMLNVPNYMIQHGIVGVSHIPFTAEKYIVHEKYTKEQLIKLGADENRIIIGGMPSADKLFTYKRNKKEITEIKNALILSDTQGAIIYPEIYEQFFKTIKIVVETNSGINFIVKLHPAEDLSLYEQNGLTQLNNLAFLPKEISLLDSFHQADLAITIWSTAGLEAMIFGLPLLVLDVNEYVKEIAWWPKFGGGKFYSEINTNILSNSIFNILDEQEKFLKQNLINQGKSGEFIYNKISQC